MSTWYQHNNICKSELFLDTFTSIITLNKERPLEQIRPKTGGKIRVQVCNRNYTITIYQQQCIVEILVRKQGPLKIQFKGDLVF